MAEVNERLLRFKHPRTKPLIRVFKGGALCNMKYAFDIAIRRFPSNLFDVEYLINDDVKIRRLNERTLVDWLLDSDVHIILTHIHQGLNFDSTKLYEQLQRLKYHSGYPNGDNLSCPVFIQDKYEYIEILNRYNYCNPTLKIKFNKHHDYSDYHIEIKNFMTRHSEDRGWVLKTPFSTNKQNVVFINNFDDIMKTIKSKSEKLKGKIPYIMLQPTMKNKMEYKVVIVGSEVRYLLNTSQKAANSKAFSYSPHKELIEFACKVLDHFRNDCSYAIVDGLLRIDIFQNKNGDFVVNELESFEAIYYSTKHYNELQATSSLGDFWYNHLQKELFLPEVLI